jgi:hypothetical protein
VRPACGPTVQVDGYGVVTRKPARTVSTIVPTTRSSIGPSLTSHRYNNGATSRSWTTSRSRPAGRSPRAAARFSTAWSGRRRSAMNDRRRDHLREDPLQVVIGHRPLAYGEQFEQVLAQVAGVGVDRCLHDLHPRLEEQFLLRGPAAVDGRLAHPGAARHRVDGESGDTDLGDQFERRRQDGSGRLLAPRPSASHGRGVVHVTSLLRATVRPGALPTRHRSSPPTHPERRRGGTGRPRTRRVPRPQHPRGDLATVRRRTRPGRRR